MRSYKSILTILLSFLSVVLLSHTEFAYTASSLYESQIFSESSEVKVKKLQEVFKGLGLYF
ncbi:MAG: hypothetical protein LBF15_04925 [Candidatus Peribacteria bacterium]|nr:hypothetical protein [Candidatus Peribacteria bacterium]